MHQPLGQHSSAALDMWTMGGGVVEPCGPSGHVDQEGEDEEMGNAMCGQERKM